MKRFGYLLVTLALLAAACADSTNEADLATTSSLSDPTSTTATAQSSTTTTPATTTTTTTTPPVTTTTLAAAGQSVNVYFVIDGVAGADGPFVRPVNRPIEPTAGVAAAAVNLLIDGPTPDEQAGTPAMSGGLPDGTRLLGLTIADGTARVDLSSEIENIGGTFGELSVLAQLVFTLTQFSTVDDVVLLIEGEQVEEFGSHGLDVTPSLDRAGFFESGLVPEILIEAPAWFAQVENPALVFGIARAFEATVQWALYDNDGLLLAEGFTVASTGAPDWGTFQFSIPYAIGAPQLGALMMWEESARDGSQIHLVEHPIWLSP